MGRRVSKRQVETVTTILRNRNILVSIPSTAMMTHKVATRPARAKKPENDSPILPSLPPELLRVIFREATEPELGLLQYAAPPIVRTRKPLQWAYDQALEKRCKRIAFTKSAISSVSKLWREAAVEFLLEILFFDFKTIEKRVSQLEQANLFGYGGDALPFQHVRYIIVNHAYFYSDSLPWDLLRLLKNCSKLVVYQHQQAHQPPENYLSSLLKSCGKTLRRLDLGAIDIKTDFVQLLNTMASRLEYLVIGSWPSAAPLENSTLSLPALHTIIMNVQGRFADLEYDLPRLENITLGAFGEMEQDNIAFLKRLPKHVKALDLSEVKVSNPGDILSIFPNLEVLVLHSASKKSWGKVVGCYPSLREIGVLLREVFEGDHLVVVDLVYHGAETIFEALTNRDIFPALETIYLWELEDGAYAEDDDDDFCLDEDGEKGDHDGDEDANDSDEDGEDEEEDEEEEGDGDGDGDALDDIYADMGIKKPSKNWQKKWARKLDSVGILLRNRDDDIVGLSYK